MGKLYVVRHGETDQNVKGIYTGSIDIDLNERGEEQARRAAEGFKDKPVDIIISSTMKRALKTATIISLCIDKPILKLGEFVERNVGVYEGLTRDEVKQTYPELWNGNVLYQFDGTLHRGESIRQVRERVHRGLQYIIDNYRNKNIILVTHGYISREIYAYFNKVTEDEFRKYAMDNCQIAEYELG
jgi:probable phosphoglycerate mutase